VETLSDAWSERGDDPSIAGERLERYESEEDALARRSALEADVLPCDVVLDDGNVVTTVPEPPVDLGADGPESQFITRTFGWVPDRVPGPAGHKHQYQVKLYSDHDVVAVVLDVPDEDRALLEDLVAAAWSRYSSAA
jgi:hypothetical protein